MKKSLLCLALLMGLLLCASVSWAMTPIHQAMYDWYDSFGTTVSQTLPSAVFYSIGDTSGQVIAEVFEKVWDVNDDGTVGQFSWTVWNDDISGTVIPGKITSFHVLSLGYEPTWYEAPPGWSFSHDGTYYKWEAPEGTGIGPGASLNNMQVKVNTTLWTVSNGGIDYFVDHQRIFNDGEGYWRTSHPNIPEPSSMLLLGLGLVGFAGKVRRRFKA